jgi:hypothetical protein
MTIKQQGGIFGRNPTFNTITSDGNASIGGDIVLQGGNKVYFDGGVDNYMDMFSADKIRIAVGGAASFKLENPPHNAFILNSSGNIKLLSGSGTSELFDDYEEGTWTPVVTSGSIAGTGITYSGRYTKIGDTVTVYFQAATTGAVNDLVVASYVGLSGLPFAVASNLTSSGYSTTEDIDRSLGGEANVNGSILYLGACGSGSFTSKISATITYFTS